MNNNFCDQCNNITYVSIENSELKRTCEICKKSFKVTSNVLFTGKVIKTSDPSTLKINDPKFKAAISTDGGTVDVPIACPVCKSNYMKRIVTNDGETLVCRCQFESENILIDKQSIIDFLENGDDDEDDEDEDEDDEDED